MNEIKTLRLSLLTFILSFAGILLFTISPVSGVLHAATPILFSGTTTAAPPNANNEPAQKAQPQKEKPQKEKPQKAQKTKKSAAKKTNAKPKRAEAIFAMGCFWCAESDFEKVDGVISVVSGYTGGTTSNPSYEDVSYKNTGHYEAVLVTYDPRKIRYGQLLKTFWGNVDPFDEKGQFCDKGSSYRAAIFAADGVETIAANASRDYLVNFFKRDLATKVLPKAKFYPAEDYHQDFYKNNSVRYNLYRSGCGRDNRLEAIWGKKK